jgi:hypothetical protein
VTPCRVLDTRNPDGPLGGPALAPSSSRTFTVAGVCGIPTGAKAISLNLTVVPTASGFMTLYPGNETAPGTSTINFVAGRTRANNAIVTLATDGSGTIAILNGSGGSNDAILDVNGYFQ